MKKRRTAFVSNRKNFMANKTMQKFRVMKHKRKSISKYFKKKLLNSNTSKV